MPSPPGILTKVLLWAGVLVVGGLALALLLGSTSGAAAGFGYLMIITGIAIAIGGFLIVSVRDRMERPSSSIRAEWQAERLKREDDTLRPR